MLRDLARPLLVAVAAGLFMAVVGAFGTDGNPLWFRAAYWVGVIVAGALISHVVVRLVDARGWFGERRWARAALVTALVTPPITLMVWFVTHVLYRGGAGYATPIHLFPPVLAVTVVMVVLTEFAARTPVQTHAQTAGSAPPRFLERLPFKLQGAELRAVEAEDHYLRVHTDRGSDLLLMRLSDALAELEGIEGAQTHRSWWVARAAVEDARRSDGRGVLKLKGGVEAPVSRTYARALREAGWF
ncbi:MAG TPA: LytTR family DNA-binding domain-containing protein [Caulobacteraceae bacterium]